MSRPSEDCDRTKYLSHRVERFSSLRTLPPHEILAAQSILLSLITEFSFVVLIECVLVLQSPDFLLYPSLGIGYQFPRG